MPRLHDFGGEAELWRRQDSLSRSAIFPEVVSVIANEWDSIADRQSAVTFVELGVTTTDNPLVLATALDELLSHPALLEVAGERIAAALGPRAEREHRREHPVEAHFAVGALVRLAIGGWTTRYRTLGLLTSLDGDEHPDFAIPAARYLGVCFDYYRDTELVTTLRRLLTIPDSESDAAFELGMCALHQALEQTSADGVTQGLAEARCWFTSAEAVDEERHDARLFGLAIDALLAFSQNGSDLNLNEAVDEFGELLRLRLLWLSGTHESWLAPRATAEIEWYRLVVLLREASALLARPSWLDARTSLDQVLQAYSASRAIRIYVREGEQSGLPALIEPRIEARFIEEEGLRAHLEDALSEEHQTAAEPREREAAELIRQRLRAGDKKKGERPPRNR